MNTPIEMSDIRQAIFELVQSQKENALQQKETARRFEEITLQQKETARRFEEITLQREKDAKENALQREKEAKENALQREKEAKENALQREKEALERKEAALQREKDAKENALQREKDALERKETEKQFRETDRRLKELGIQIGGLGERFGSFTEGMAINSMEKMLRREFKADHVAARSKVYDKSGQIAAEYDILAWCNSDINNVVVVEVKSTLKPNYIVEFEKTLKEFKGLNPELANKNLFGILAFVGNFDKKLEQHCLSKGIYTATIHDEIFKLNAPKTFNAKNFNL